MRRVSPCTSTLDAQNVKITVSKEELDDYICITDIANVKSDSVRAADVVRNWLRNRGTLEYLSVWEQIYNPEFKVFESEHFKRQVGLLTFTPSATEWINQTNAIDYM
ncbi:KilA-N domain-containing protein [Mediterraneibacter glycyrrhizinilyticus]|uniref:KilA-N domain-containing protein n=1 Tax=Mediterraneibacter glycyrrhizinilyticus TaxID=342942 RepID=UPI00241F54A2